jgi:hypothetical protein
VNAKLLATSTVELRLLLPSLPPERWGLGVTGFYELRVIFFTKVTITALEKPPVQRFPPAAYLSGSLYERCNTYILSNERLSLFCDIYNTDITLFTLTWQFHPKSSGKSSGPT